MINAQRTKLASLARPQLKNNGSVVSDEVDCRGFDYAVVKINIGAIDIAMSALKVTECDDTGGTFTDVTGAIFGTSENIAGDTSALPSSTDDNKFWRVEIDLKGRKRFLKIVATVGSGSTGAYLAIEVELSRAEEAPKTAAEAGCEEILRV